MGSPLHVISMSCSLCTLTPSLIKFEIGLPSAILPMLMREVRKSSKASAWLAFGDKSANESLVTCFAWMVPPFATPMHSQDCLRIGRPTLIHSFSLM